MEETKLTHQPVLLSECLEGLNIRPDGIYVDGTFGRGGHSMEIAKRLETGRLICIDRDQAALEAGKIRASGMDKFTFVHGNFKEISAILEKLGLDQVDGMLFDLGVSSPQLDEAARGFSYLKDAPLDMRMDQSQSLTAWDVVNKWPKDELKQLLYTYGEERYAPLIAAAIARRRETSGIDTTLELAQIIRDAMPKAALREKQHPAKRSFQAIRIAVNDELTAIGDMPPGCLKASSRRPDCGDLFSLFRGSDCEDHVWRAGKRMHLSAGFSSLCLWEDAGIAAGQQKAHRPEQRGTRKKSKSPQRKTAHWGENINNKNNRGGRSWRRQ